MNKCFIRTKKLFFVPDLGRRRATSLFLLDLRYIRPILIFCCSAWLSGCMSFGVGESEYSCPGMPNGVQCMSARDVYAATNDGNIPKSVAKGEEAEASNTDVKNISVNGNKNNEPSMDSTVNTFVAPQLPDKPIPVRAPATVMRIWIAPWEDKNGDLIVIGKVFTEIEPRRWVIGDVVQEKEPVLRPLQTIQQPTTNPSNQ